MGGWGRECRKMLDAQISDLMTLKIHSTEHKDIFAHKDLPLERPPSQATALLVLDS